MAAEVAGSNPVAHPIRWHFLAAGGLVARAGGALATDPPTGTTCAQEHPLLLLQIAGRVRGGLPAPGTPVLLQLRERNVELHPSPQDLTCLLFLVSHLQPVADQRTHLIRPSTSQRLPALTEVFQ